MSGGEFDYLSYKIEEVAEEMEDLEIIEITKDFANLIHAAEWYKSGDTDRGDYNQAVKEFKNKWLRGYYRQELIDNKINNLREELINSFCEKKYCQDCKCWEQAPDVKKYGNCKYCKGYLKHSYDNICQHFEEKNEK